VKHGIIQKLEINIPWATLLHNPVKISISGVFLDVGPMDLTKVSKKEALQRYFNEKLQKLKMIDQYFELSSTVEFDDDNNNSSHNKSDDGLATTADSEEANQSYLQQWTTKIIDNIEITVSNVHFRYEEDPSSSSSPSQTPPGVTPFACGITIEAFGIATCNELWNQVKSGNHTSDNNNTNKATVSTTAPASSSTQTNSNNNSNSCVNKLAYLKGFGIYWQENIPFQQSFASLPPKLWEKMMLEFISKTTTIAGMKVINNLNDSNRAKDTTGRSNTTGVGRGVGEGVGGGSIHHILSPYNSNLTLKLRHHRKPTPMTAQVEIEAVSGKLQISIDSVVYVHLFSVLDRVAAMGKLHEPTTIRPMERPSGSREACRMWWKYAMKLVIKMKRYIELIKLAHSLSGGKKDPVSYLPPISALIVRELEIKLPFESLSVGRQRAIWELHEEAKQRERLRQAQGWGWGGWLGGASAPIETATASSSRDTTSMDISIESIIGELNKKYSTNIASNSKSSTIVPTTTLSFNLDSSASLLISSRGVPIINGSAALSIHLLRTSSAGMTFSCDLHDFYIKDELTTDPTLPYLLAVKSTIYPTMLPLRSNVPPSTHLQKTSSDDNIININGTSGSSSSSIKTATLSLRYEKSNAKSKVTMSSLPMELVLNKDCIQMLINAFQRPVNIYTSNKGKRKRSSRRDNHRNSDTQQQQQSSTSIFHAARIFNQIVQKHNADDDVLEVVLEAHAPKIIIPESSSAVGDHHHHRHHGYLLIDCGYFQLNGLSSSSGISLDLSLQEVCVGLPISIADMYTLGEKSLYLIKVSTVIQ